MAKWGVYALALAWVIRGPVPWHWLGVVPIVWVMWITRPRRVAP